MGFFTPPKNGALYYTDSGMRSHPELHRRGLNEKKEKKIKNDHEDSEIKNDDGNVQIDETIEKEGDKPEEKEIEKKEKKVGKTRNKEHFDPETSKNTHLNSLIYHTSNDTIDLYTKENNSSDLLGRIYYDDFDSDSVTSPLPSVTNTPLLSPSGSAIGLDYFNSNNRISSSTNLRTISSVTSMEEKFKNGISFDLSDNNASKKSLTLKVKHPKFKFRRNNKTFLSGFNEDNESLKAIKWLFDEMIINGDTIVVLQVLDEKLYDKIDRKRAYKNLTKIEELNIHNKKISIVYELDIGKPQKLLEKAIDEYKPQMMCIGTHQDDDLQHKSIFSKTTISKFFLQYALVPVVVVKPKYNHKTELNHEIDSVDYFKNWLKNIDISETYFKDKKKKNRPSLSRNNSSNLVEERGRRLDDDGKLVFQLSSSRSRSRSESKDNRSTSQRRHRFSKLFHIEDH